MTYQGDFVGLGVAPVPEDDLPGVVVVPVPVVGEGVVPVPVVGEGVVPVVGESAGEVVVPVGDSVGEEPPAGVSPPVFGWQAALNPQHEWQDGVRGSSLPYGVLRG
jgi:hypothetical protein